RTVVKSISGSSPIDIGDLQRTYAVVREIGRGGMGAVVLARHREARHYVAIKIASTDKLDAEALARFSREAYLMARFRHPNIVSLYAVEPIGQGRVGIVMEYVRGQSLARLLSSGKRLPLEACTRIVRDLGKALAHAHAHGVVHRDVKPQNVLVEDESGAAKLADFGIAKVTTDTADVTATGAALGTPAYMSPEQIDGAPLDGRSDIYSLGVLAWEMVTGQRPWAGEPLFKLLYKQKHEALPAVTIFRPDTGMGLQLAIEGALAKDPAARWATVNDMLAQLEEDHPTPALLARREREAGLLRARGAGAPSDASTVPVRRHAPAISESPTPPESSAGEELAARGERARTPVEQVPQPPEPSRAVTRTQLPWWRRQLPFVGGLMLGTVAMLSVFWWRSSSPVVAGGAVAAPPASEPVSAGASPGLATSSVESRTGGSVPPPPPASAPADGGPAGGGVPPAGRGGTRGRASSSPDVAPDVAPPTAPRGGTRSPARGAEPAAAITPRPATSTAAAAVANVPGSGGAATTLGERAAAYALANQARGLVYAGERSRVSALIDSALVLDPRNGSAYALRARLRTAEGEVRDAWTDVEMAARTGARWESLALSTMLRVREEGTGAAARRLTGEVRAALTPRRPLDAERAVGLAAALAQVGDTATALTILEQGNRDDPGMRTLLMDPLLHPLRRSARFDAVRRDASR
ncbi:MAG TPA: serine/threonine-protein kinase, partial [Gemmatimonadaceae bacterium]|nr:serine/threonine-protein kinase [Gemmatimonadaceae bacterium]